MAKDTKPSKTQLLEELKRLRVENTVLEQSQQLFLKGPVVVFRWCNTKGWPVDYASPNVCDLFGYTDDEFSTSKVLYEDLIAAPDLERVTAEVERASREGAEVFDHKPYRIIHKDGTERWLCDHTVVLRNDNNEITHYYGYVFDITERKRADEALSFSESLLSEAQEVAHVGNWNLDLRTGKATWSDEEYRLLGYEPQAVEFTVDNFMQAVHPDDRESVRSEMERVMRPDEKEPYHIEHRVVFANGDIRYVEERARVSFDKKGKPLRMFGTTQDVTERKCMEQQLLESRKQHLEAERLAHLGHWQLCQERNEFTWSPEVFNIFEIDPEQFNASYDGFLNTIHPEDRDRVDQAYTESVVNRTPYDIVHRLLMKDGSTKFVREKCNNYYSDNGETMRSIGTVQDITQTKETELSLLNAYDELQLKLDVRASDIAELSHQIEEGIHKRVQVEGELKKSEQKYRRLMENASDAIFVLEPKTGLILNANEEAARLTGRTVEQLKGMKQSQLYPEGEAKKYLRVYHDHIRSGSAYEDEVLVQHKDGRKVPVEIHASAIEVEGRKLVQGILRDITEKKEKEQALIESEKRFRALYDHAPVAYQSLDESGLLIEVNQTWLDIFGYPSEEVIGRSFDEFLAPGYSEHFKKSFRAFKAAGEISDVEFEMVNKDGSSRFISVVGKVMYDSQERFTKTYCTLYDISKRKQMERALEKANEEWEQTFNTVSDPIAIIDTEYRILKANKAMVERLGQSKDEFLGKTCYSCIHGEDTPLDNCPQKKLIEDGQEHTAEIFEKNLDADFFVTTSPLYDSSNKLLGSVHVSHDITERKKAEEERLAIMGKQKDELVREVHHRIKNHLQGLMGLMKQRRRIGDQHIDIIDEAISQIESIAVVYGLQTDQIGAQIFFKQMLEAIVRSVSGLSQIPLSVASDSVASACEINRDKAVALALVINELVMNAVKHSQARRNEQEIRILYKCVAEGVGLEISNPGNLPDGFDFEKGKGLGTGLEMAKIMLPSKGARWSISEKDNEVVAKLVLSPPLLIDVE